MRTFLSVLFDQSGFEIARDPTVMPLVVYVTDEYVNVTKVLRW